MKVMVCKGLEVRGELLIKIRECFVRVNLINLNHYAILLIFIIARVLVPGRPSLMLMNKARTFLIDAPFRCSTLG